MGNMYQILYIKNMVCPRCKEIVKQILQKSGCRIVDVALGRAVIKSNYAASENNINVILQDFGFGLLQSIESRRVERVRTLLIQWYYFQQHAGALPLREYIELGMQCDYEKLDNLFYATYGLSIADYNKLMRFERAKELVSYHEQSLHDIASCLGYDNTDCLTREFDTKLGITLEEYRVNPWIYRCSLDSLI